MSSPKVLVVEDNILVSHAVRDMLVDNGYEVEVADTGKKAEKLLKNGDFNIALLDMVLPDTHGDKLLKAWDKYADLRIIVMTAYGEVNTAVDCLKNGASDFLVKPVDKELLLKSVAKACPRGTAAPSAKATARPSAKIVTNPAEADEIIFASDKMAKTMDIASMVSSSDFSSLLITGESGSGKGMLSRAIHRMGSRSDRPLIEINCSALPANLIESELFGHKRGAFTDAKEDKVGLIEMANGGTLFLDEIGDMDIKLQSKLLKAIEEKSFRRIGCTKNIKVDIQIIAATNADIFDSINEGSFRLDLYYRLSVIPIELSPLRDRKDDIEILCKHFIKMYSRRFAKKITGFTDNAMKALKDFSWPGNVRELSNVVERGCILTKSNEITEDLLMLPKAGAALVLNGTPQVASNEVMTLAQAEENAIKAAFEKADGNKNEAARLLGVHRTTLYKKLEEYNIQVS
ncbi:MAG: sigma-54 dependent transcriptional regulator [Lentisphaeraceae bacterium]|nr:sigma-54 dependent transcriptional regulator [Lentisphaeraceae bacterium]